MKKYFVSVELITLLLTGCAVVPTHTALVNASLPELIPVREFVADRQANGGYQVSPDGKKLAWFGVDVVRPAIMVKTIGLDGVKAFPIRARYFKWTADSKKLIFVADLTGDENTHVYTGHVERPGNEIADLTPFAQTMTQVQRVVDGGGDVIVTQNRRDKKVFDLYRVDTDTGEHKLLANNPGNVVFWGVDRKGNLLARISQSGEQRTLEIKKSESWKPTAEWTIFDSITLVEFTEDGRSAWAVSNRGRDKTALVKLDLSTGKEEVVYAADNVDIDQVLFSKKTAVPLIAYYTPDYPEAEFFNKPLQEKAEAFLKGKRAGFFINSADDEERFITLSVVSDKGSRFYLYDSQTGHEELLGEDSLSRMESRLSETKPITFSSRDGLAIAGYLTLPLIKQPQNLPMIVLVHGGPWARDRWGQGGPTPQFLANRGYAVLQINYRGSAGYGRSFMEKAAGEFAGKMHDDLIDGVNWAVANGFADPKKVGIYGRSYGGYAAMVGAAFTPDVFACAADEVGPTDLARLLETAPPYWELGKHWWTRYVGDPKNPEDRKRMDAKSPLYKAHYVTKPVLILHGVNDPRVKLEQSELMVAALRKAGKKVDYVTFKGDGHGNQKWSNRLTQYRKLEDFFAGCLGGRSSGFDFYQLGSWAF